MKLLQYIGLLLLLVILSCSEEKPQEQPSSPDASEPFELRESLGSQVNLLGEPPGDGDEAALAPIEEDVLADIWPLLEEPWLGDLDEMLARGYIRILMPLSVGWYFLDKGKPHGFGYAHYKLLQDFTRKELNRDRKTLRLVLIPARRDQLLPLLLEGHGDIILSNTTITPERKEHIDFSKPWTREAQEILVMNPQALEVATIDDLSGKEVVTRPFTSYHFSLQALNRRFEEEGREPVTITLLPPQLDDADVLEMVDAGIYPMMVIDNYKLLAWGDVFKNIVVREDIVLRDNAALAMAMRKNSPQLKALLDKYVDAYPVGSLTTNVLINRYINTGKWAKKATDSEMFTGLEKLMRLFELYGQRYDIDPLMLASFAYQESHFNTKARSRAGAVGVMQILPKTAADPAIGIPDVSTVENNVHAGTKYLALLRDRYFRDLAGDPVEQMNFTMAGYNAGPNRINRLRKVAAKRGLSPDHWFNNVELVVGGEVGLEPVAYVAGIYRYYLAYQRAYTEMKAREQAREAVFESAPE